MELIHKAIAAGAKIYSNVSGGKDGQAMTKSLISWGFPVTGLLHADLGRTEWPQSMQMCERLSTEFFLPLHVVRRTDGADMLQHWQNRMHKLQGSGAPFWSSSKSRYCTSDLKRDPIDTFYRNSGNDFIISCEGIRAGESTAREKKIPLTIRERITSSYYNGMTVEEAINNYQPGKRLALTWFPIFDFSLQQVWVTYGMSSALLQLARLEYKQTGTVPTWWQFHPAYTLGNDRVSCMFCILGSLNDLQTAAKYNKPLLNVLISMETYSGATFKHNWSLKSLKTDPQ